MHYTSKYIHFANNCSITEWDIKSGNTSMMKYYGLIDKSTINKIDRLPKSKRNIAVGLIGRKDKEFAKALENSFTNIVKEFFVANDINQDDDIISVKKDAVFVLNRNISFSTFGDVVEFIPKNTYTGFINIPSFEFYYNSETVDVKGIDDTLLPLHQDGMIQFIKDVFKYSYDRHELHLYFKEFMTLYKNKELPFDMYRQFKTESNYIVIESGYRMSLDTICEDDIEDLDISYNYENIILPVFRLFI